MQAAAILSNHIKSLGFLLTSGGRSRTEIRSFQFAQLRRVVRHAYANVPFYRALYREHGFHPSLLRSIHDLNRIPTITKSDLVLLAAKTITDSRLDPHRLIRHSTSGTSGVPTTVYRTWAEERLLNAFRRRSEFAYGRRPGDTVASVMPWRRRRIGMHELLARAGFFRNRFVDALEEPEVVLARLADLEPDIVSGYPGVLERLARCMGDFHRSRIRPRFIMTGGETLTEQGRMCIEEAFGARLFDLYGSYEFNMVASECRHTGEMHTCDDNVLIEVLKGGEPAEYGETGELTGTALHSFAMPLIRYRLGDMVVKGREECRCGAPFSTILSVDGRVVDYFILPDGRHLHPYRIYKSVLWRLYPFLRQYQLVQESRGRVTLLLVLKDAANCPDIHGLVEECQAILGSGVSFHAQVTDRIPLTRSGKTLTYRSLVNRARPSKNSIEDGCP